MDGGSSRVVPAPEGETLGDALVRAARRASTQRLQEDIALLLEAAADAMRVDRASLWLLEPGQTGIACVDLFERPTRTHLSLARMARAEAPAYFDALSEARVIDAHDARSDPRTRDLDKAYLAPLGITSMLDAPVRLDGRLVGVVCHEHRGPPRRWTSEEEAFAAGIADLAAHAIRADELRGERDFARTLLQAQSDLGEGVALVGPDRRLLYANDALARLLGYTMEEMRSLPDVIHAVMPERVRAQWEGRIARLARGEHVEPRMESFIRHRSGEDIPVEIVGIDVSHREQRSRLFVIRDLTEQRRQDEAARLLRALVEATTDAVVTADVDGIIQGWNPGAERLLGWRRDEIVGQHIRAYFPLDLHGEVDRLDILRAGGSVPPYETERLRKDGQRVPVSVNLTPVCGPDGTLVAVTAILRDRRAQKALEDARRQLALTEKLSALGTLVSGVAHEIRTPLTYLQTNLHVATLAVRRALEDAPPDARAAAMARIEPSLAEAEESIERINRLVEDLRRYTRLRVGERALAPLDTVVRTAVDMFRATHRGALRIEADLQPTPPVLVDAVEVQQAALNLMQNAAEARPRDGLVRIRTAPAPGGGAQLEVEDHGSGMPREVRDRVFDAFFTTKQEGTGLGLSIVQRIVEAHQGDVTLDSAPGEGTRVVLRFPPAGASAQAERRTR